MGMSLGNGGKCVDKDTLCKENHGIGARFSYSSENANVLMGTKSQTINVH